MAIPTTAEAKHEIVESWQLPAKGEKLYSVDTVIDAYLKGKTDGLEQTTKLLRKQFEDNMNKSGDNTKKVIQHLLTKNLTPVSSHLKVDSFDSFSVLIAVSEADFLNENILSAYIFAEHLEQVVKEDLYSISFSFTNKSDSFDEDLLFSDGYIFTFKPSIEVK